MPYQWKVLPFGLATATRVFKVITKSVLFLCHHKGFHIVIYLDDILFLLHSKLADRRAFSFLCSLLVHLGLLINFPNLTFTSLRFLFFGGLCWDTVHMSVSLPPDKLAYIKQLALSLLQPNLFQSVGSCSFQARRFFVSIATHNCGNCVMSFRVTC